MGRGLLSGLWDVEAAIYTGPPPAEDRSECVHQRTEEALRAARCEAERNGWAVSIAIVSSRGEPLGLVKLDGSPPDSSRCAIAKAQQAAAIEQRGLTEETAFMGQAATVLSSSGATSIHIDDRCVIAIGVDGEDHVDATLLAKTAAHAFMRAR
ncbi:heme-binding protein [Stutzerimonas marianensis]